MHMVKFQMLALPFSLYSCHSKDVGLIHIIICALHQNSAHVHDLSRFGNYL
jgi:hypothetical protein